MYWLGVYSLSFMGGTKLKNQFQGKVPTGYQMFAPVTNTNYDVDFTYFTKGKVEKELQLSSYLKLEYQKLLVQNKSVFVKERLFQGSLKTLDFHYQKAMYAELYKETPSDFLSQTKSNPELKRILTSLENFAGYYLKENPQILADSVVISVKRIPMVLPFDSGHTNDFTYVLGEEIFYSTSKTLTK